MRRDILIPKLAVVKRDISQVWDSVVRFTPCNAGTAFWYMELRMEWARINEARPAHLENMDLINHAHRMQFFVVTLGLFENVVFKYSGTTKMWDDMLDSSESLGTMIDKM